MRELYCRVLCSQFLIFLFGVVSVYTVVFLSIERWLAVRYPFKYRTSISSCKVKACAVCTWCLGLLANAPHLSEMSPTNGGNRNPSCQWKYKDYQTRQTIAFVEMFLKFIIPTLILALVLLSLYRKVHQNFTTAVKLNREGQLLRMCAATSFSVLLCWSPNQVYYLLYKFNVVNIGTKLHHCTVVLALSTSAINPLIYYVTSTAYRRRLVMFLCKVFSKCRSQVKKKVPR